MRMVLFTATLIMVQFIACTNKDKIPSEIIPKEKMAEVFFDLSMAEGFVENYHARDSSWVRDSVLTSEVDKVLTIHKISQQQFRKSYDFYKMHPPLFKVVIDTVYAKAQRSREDMFKKPKVE